VIDRVTDNVKTDWIQGHPLGRKFKALVCHDGVFSTLHMWQTEELFFPIHDFGGTMWENRAGYEKWDPAKAEFLSEWATPQLVIHSELDYRLPVTEGMAAFNVLQQKGVPSRFLVFPDENHVSDPVSCRCCWCQREGVLLIQHVCSVGPEARELVGMAQGSAGLDQQVYRAGQVRRGARGEARELESIVTIDRMLFGWG